MKTVLANFKALFKVKYTTRNDIVILLVSLSFSCVILCFVAFLEVSLNFTPLFYFTCFACQYENVPLFRTGNVQCQKADIFKVCFYYIWIPRNLLMLPVWREILKLVEKVFPINLIFFYLKKLIPFLCAWMKVFFKCSLSLLVLKYFVI